MTPAGNPASCSRFHDADAAERHLLGRLEDERVPAHQRHREHPQRHHRGEVERGDAHAHAERMALRFTVHVRDDVFQRLAGQQSGQPTGVLDHLDPAIDRRVRLGERLAVLARHQAGKLLAGAPQALHVLEHDAGPLHHRGLAPGAERLVRRPDGPVDLVGRAKRNARNDLAGGGVGHLPEASCLGFGPLAADQHPARGNRIERCLCHAWILSSFCVRASIPDRGRVS